jgi:hypothetical protein
VGWVEPASARFIAGVALAGIGNTILTVTLG